MRIGTGYDVHRLGADRKMIIGGVEIPFEMGLIGHSDADVLAHAITDALLGAASLGDIGKLFPDTDDTYKDADSIILMKKAYEKVLQKGFCLSNIDAIIIAQAPKMRPYIDEMQKNIAQALDVDIDRINIKATTEEGLGFTGSGQGISSQAVCLLNENNEGQIQ